MKRLISAAAALMMLAGLASCGGSVPSASNSTSGQESSGSSGSSDTNIGTTEQEKHIEETADKVLTDLYKPQEVKLPDDIMDIWEIEHLGTSEFVINYAGLDYETKTYKADHALEKFVYLDYDLPKECFDYDFHYSMELFNTDGSFNTLVFLENHDGMVMPKEFDENFDYETYNNNAEHYYMVCSYDAEGKLLSNSSVEFPEECTDEYGLRMTSPVSMDDNIYGTFEDNTIRRISCADGSVTTVGQVDMPENYYGDTSLFNDRDGKVIAAIPVPEEYDNDYGTSYMTGSYDFCEVSDTLSVPFYNCMIYDMFSCKPSSGFDEYRIIVPKEDALYGVLDDGSEEVLINWQNSGLSPMMAVPAGNREFLAIKQSYDSNGGSQTKLLKLVPRDPSEMANTKIITLGAAYFSDFWGETMNDFNNSQDKYHVNLVTYGSYDPSDPDSYQSGMEEARNELYMDLISGNAPDIFMGLEYGTYQNLMKKGVFTDLGQLMDGDSEYSRDSFVPSILTSMQDSDGNIYALPTGFYCRSKMVKTKYWSKPSWTLDEMIEFFDNAPDTAIHLYDSVARKEEFQDMACSMEDLIDYENGTCSFDSPDFKKILEFCNRFAEEENIPSKFEDGYEAVDNYYYDKFHWLENDKVLTLDVNADTSINLAKYLQGGGEEMTLVGYPTNSGSGGRIVPNNLLCISSSCTELQGAWEFIIYYITHVPDHAEGGYSPLLNDLEEAIYGEVGVQHSASGVEYPPLSQEDADMIMNYILACDGIGTSFDTDLWAICTEEAGEYFAGAISAETAAERIQNRAEILISEKQ